MRIGVPTEVKNHEYRVAITPAGVAEFVRRGHQVSIQAGAGAGSSITDDDFVTAGARILPDADAVWADADLLLKVKEPIAERVPPDAGRAGALHLPAPRRRPATAPRRSLDQPGTTGIAYETVELADRLAAAAGPDVRGGRPARPAGRCLPA